MLPGSFFYPTPHSHVSTTWPIALQNTHGAAQLPYADASVSHHGSSYTIPRYPTENPAVTRPSKSAFEVCGYLYGQGRVRDDLKGKYLEYMLQSKNIDLEVAPPFQPVTDKAGYAAHGVVKINNIPFTVSAQEITQFINRFAATPMLKKNHDGYPIHIIMEKPTGKTMDCFVEFPTHAAAAECVRRFEYTASPGRGTKLGTRNVSLDLSNQTELMVAVFPRARLVEFDHWTGKPSIISQKEDSSWSEGFRGYFTLEEVYGVMRFAECPSRSPFVLKCHQRVYECMISTLYKFPWAATQTYTVAARNALFEAAYKQLTILSKKIGTPIGPAADTSLVLYNYNDDVYSQYPDQNFTAGIPGQLRPQVREVGLSQSLLFDLLFAAVNVPSFSLLQKLVLCQAAGSYGRGIPLSPFSESWPFQSLEPATDTPAHIVKFWLELFDSGFDIIEMENTRTTFEDYIVFTRNMVGFPIAEWTIKGTELPFEDAIRVESAAMMVYVVRGRQAWANERGIDINLWELPSLMKLMADIAMEEMDGRHFEEGERANSTQPDLSPKSTVSPFPHHIEPRQKMGAFGAIGEPSPQKSSNSSGGRFNPATATDFVPTSNNTSVPRHSAEVKNIGDLERTTQACNTYCPDAANAQTVHFTQYTPHRLNTTFKDPFVDTTTIPTASQHIQASRSRPTLFDVSPLDNLHANTALSYASTTAPTQSREFASAKFNQSRLPQSLVTQSHDKPIGERMRNLSIATTIVHSPDNNSSVRSWATSILDDENHSFSSSEPNQGSATLANSNNVSDLPQSNLALPAQEMNRQALPAPDFGPIGTGTSVGAGRSLSYAPNTISDAHVSARSGTIAEKIRAYSIPVTRTQMHPETHAHAYAQPQPRVHDNDNDSIKESQYRQNHEHTYHAGNEGRLSAMELWNGIGKR